MISLMRVNNLFRRVEVHVLPLTSDGESLRHLGNLGFATRSALVYNLIFGEIGRKSNVGI